MPARFFLDLLFPPTDTLTQCERISFEALGAKLEPRVSDTPIHTTALFSYRDRDVETLIKGLKYHRFHKAAEMFGFYMGEYLIEALADESLLGNFEKPILIPIPITEQRRIERGFNQTELITKHMLQQLNQVTLAYSGTDVLKRIGLSQSQALSNKEEREQNVIDRFVVKQAGLIKDTNILLVDDVITTGATLHSAAEALKGAGARDVRAIVVAH